MSQAKQGGGKPTGKSDAGIGYVGFANLPNQVHRKSVKKGFEFTLMVVGESGLGKSTLVDSLFLTDLYDEIEIPRAIDRIHKTVQIETNTVEIEEKGIRLRLTVVDTPGFADAVDNSECWKPVVEYVDKQNQGYLCDESGLNRKHIVDNRVHCCLYFVNPQGHGLKPLDIKFMKELHHKVNIVPVIAKSDTLTPSEIRKLKHKINEEVQENGISIYTFPDCDSEDEDEFVQINQDLKASVPFAVVGSNTVIDCKGKKVRGRLYPWGVVEVENPNHCDFVKLRNMLIRTHMQDLKDVTQEVHYENFRSEKLKKGGTLKKIENMSKRKSQVFDFDDIEVELTEKEKMLQAKDAELKRMQEMLSKMQKQMETQMKQPQTTVSK